MKDLLSYENNISWMNEYIKDVPLKRKKIYKLMCFFLFRWKKGLKYKELYMILSNIYKILYGKTLYKNAAILEVLFVYHFNNKKLPYNI